MSKTAVASPDAPAAIGPYSPAIQAGDLVFVSGQMPVDPATGNIVPGTAADQARQCLTNVATLIKAAGLTMDAVVKTTVFIKDMDAFAAINAVYAEFFKEPFPARSCVEVARLPRDVQVEVEVIAKRG